MAAPLSHTSRLRSPSLLSLLPSWEKVRMRVSSFCSSTHAQHLPITAHLPRRGDPCGRPLPLSLDPSLSPTPAHPEPVEGRAGTPPQIVTFSPLTRIPTPATIPHMKTKEQLFADVERLLDAMGIPKEPPKGSFYDLSSDEAQDDDAEQGEKPKRKRGGQPGNQNARKHGFYSKHFTLEQLNQLEDANDLKDLGPEIALMRIKLNTLLDDPEASTELVIRAVNSLARLMSIQRRYIYG